MILAIAVVAGYFVGVWRASKYKTGWQVPTLRHFWLIPIFFLPQLLLFYLPGGREHLGSIWVSALLIVSLIGLLLFCLINWRLQGLLVLALGLLLNLIAIASNRGLMPISTVTAGRLVSPEKLATLQVGSRFGSSKDVLLSPEMIVFPWLADRFTPPAWFPYQFAYSIGDIFIGLGAFLLLSFSTSSVPTLQER